MRFKKQVNLFTLFLVAAFVLVACAPSATPAPTQDINAIQTQAAQTVVANLTQNAPAATQPPAPPESTPTPVPPPGPTPDPNIPVAVVPTPAPGDAQAVADYNTLIFSGPGDNYVVYGALLGGKTTKVIGVSEDSQWWVISVPPAPNGQGWVSAGWVTVSNTSNVAVVPTPPVPPTTDLVPPGPNDPQASALANVYVRTGPGANYPAYGIAKMGASGRVIGQSEDRAWWVVRLNPQVVGAGYGWVQAGYTQASNVENIQTIATPPPPSASVPPPPPAGAPSATALEYINVRSGPGVNYPVLVIAAPGASGEVSGKSADGAWWQVKISTAFAPDGFGWVSAGYVYTQNTQDVPVVEAPPAPPPVEPTPPPTIPMSCALVAQDPADGNVLAPGTGFNTTWVLQNTGEATWDQNSYDVLYIGAAGNVPLHQGADIYDLSNSVDPNWTYSFSVPMIAPIDPGTYGELWRVVHGSEVICQFYVYVQVQ